MVMALRQDVRGGKAQTAHGRLGLTPCHHPSWDHSDKLATLMMAFCGFGVIVAHFAQAGQARRLQRPERLCPVHGRSTLQVARPERNAVQHRAQRRVVQNVMVPAVIKDTLEHVREYGGRGQLLACCLFHRIGCINIEGHLLALHPAEIGPVNRHAAL